MTTLQLENNILKFTKGLPSEALLEILDFIQFIRERKLPNSYNDNLKQELTKLDEVEASHVEEEFLNYKTLYPLED
ncbi:MAG TPA: hypothetical protein PLG86_07450 [Bacteroidales bacterium]|nr:hypothetical protein [Bacteroidales bacterium]